jgi:hypothetical protein
VAIEARRIRSPGFDEEDGFEPERAAATGRVELAGTGPKARENGAGALSAGSEQPPPVGRHGQTWNGCALLPPVANSNLRNKLLVSQAQRSPVARW